MEQKYSVNTRIGSFEIVSAGEATELGGILYEMKSTICGARLLFCHTSEENKLFSVTFKTIPSDDTGVFHILEHSVLNGSKKYPVREPFVEMMKSSLNTFLNAMTFPDKTMYPVSSRNEKDFINLTSVYLDAVFNPLIYTNPNIFYQEGWHYEVDPDSDTAVVNGVVYSEMKGAEASADERMVNSLNRMLFPDTCYRFNSGGATTDIPKLTYEQFIDTHKKFYSPDNAVFYIEGDLDVNVVIPMIDEYLYHEDSFDPSITVINKQEKTGVKKDVVLYPVSEGEDLRQKTIYSFSKLWCDSMDRTKIFGAKMINSYLNSSNSSPLMKRMIERGLANDVTISVQAALAQAYLSIDIYGSEDGMEDDIRKCWREVCDEIRANGFVRDELEATLCRLEFIAREESEPKAIGHAVAAVSRLLYGGNPLDALEFGSMLKELREGLDNGYFMRLFEEIFDESDMCLVIAKPSTTVAATEEEQERKLVNELTKDWTSEDYKKARDIEENLRNWQKTPDSSEAIDSIPKLKLSDVSSTPPKRITNVMELNGVRILTHPAQLADISYLKFYFPINKKFQDRVGEINFLTNLITELPTGNYDVIALNRMLKKNFGSFNTAFSCGSYRGINDEAFAFMSLSVSVMKSNISAVPDAISEIFLGTIFDNKEIILSILDQTLDGCREDLISEGNYIARNRARASGSVYGSIVERIDGYDYYKMLKEFRNDFDSKIDSFIEFAREFITETFTRDALTISFTISEADSVSESFFDEYKVKSILDAIPEGTSDGRNNPDNRKADIYRLDYKMPFVKKTFIRIPGKVGFASSNITMSKYGTETDGRWSVMTSVVRLEYLWNRVRVQGGAYGVNMSASNDNSFSFTSYRDPSGVKTFEAFAESYKALKAIIDEGIDLEKFIISALNRLEPLVTPKHYGSICDRNYLEETTDEIRARNYKLRLNMTPDDLLKISDQMKEVILDEDCVSMCLVGSNPDEFNPDVILEM